MTERRLLLAGSFGPERIPTLPDPDDADWYLPLHRRDQRAAVDRIAAQISVGADVVVAPTWLTHRRALLPIGETRRASEWTAAAVRVARDGVELGLERRAERSPPDEAPDLAARRPIPRIAASLPSLDEEQVVATLRDYRDQAGLIADSEPDLILVEGQRTPQAARDAVGEAVGTGLAVWAALGGIALAAEDLEEWLDWARATGVARLLLPPAAAERMSAVADDLSWGVTLRDVEPLAHVLDAGAGTIALLDGATTSALEPLRTALDEHERASLQAEASEHRRWLALVDRAASMAPGGEAVWIGPAPEHFPPGGFHWQVVDESEISHLPDERFRLAVTVRPLARPIERLLEHGGMLVAPLPHPQGLRPIVVDEQDPPLAISRREGRVPSR